MNKEQQIKEMAVIGCVRNPQAKTAEECGKCDFRQGMCNAYRHAENLYNAGYRKTFTSDLASDTQKAYKEGYIKGIEDREAENERLTERLKQVLLSIDTVKEMNAMCNIDEQRKQAVKEFAEWIKDNITDIPFCNQKAYNIFCDMVNEKLKEYEK